jgi:histidinol-phosphate aminotransferase
MNAATAANPAILTQPIYDPGKPLEELVAELGLGPEGMALLASNENPFGSSPIALEAARRAIGQSRLYPDGGCLALRRRLASAWGLEPGQFVVGNGSNELLELLAHLWLRPGTEAVMGSPAFIAYRLVTLLFGATPVEVPLAGFRHDLRAMRRAVSERTRLVFLASPNNPTGGSNTQGELVAFIRDLPESAVVVFDEAYAEYEEAPADLRCLIAEGRRLVCLRTFSKIYGLASLRIGYAYTSNEMAALLNRARQPFNVNAVAQAAAIAALDDRQFVRRCARANRDGLRQMEAGFQALGLPYAGSSANFVMVKVGNGNDCATALLRHGIVVRPLGAYRLPEWVRITVGTAEQNERVLAHLEAFPALERTVGACAVKEALAAGPAG